MAWAKKVEEILQNRLLQKIVHIQNKTIKQEKNTRNTIRQDAHVASLEDIQSIL